MTDSAFDFMIKPQLRVCGRVRAFKGGFIIADGPPLTNIGDLCQIVNDDGNIIEAEVVGFENEQLLFLPYQEINGLALNAKIKKINQHNASDVSHLSLLGKLINYRLQECSQDSNVSTANIFMPLKPIKANARSNINQQLISISPLINTLLPIGKGQRIGLFAGSGVGKTSLLLNLLYLPSDIKIIALIGERGREVSELMASIPPILLKTTIVIVATSDEAALARKKALYQAHALSQSFSKDGKDVLLLVDSVTRFAMALREIGLSLGEPPTSRGYTPSVFQTLPKLFEQAGNFKNQGSITAIYTVLVEGDDFNDPISDTCRALLDGHICLNRELANSGFYPAIDVLSSVSRFMGALFNTKQIDRVHKIKSLFQRYIKARSLMDIGAYKTGDDQALDLVVNKVNKLEKIFYSGVETNAVDNPKKLELTIDNIINEPSQ